jgi:hypothetical protein
LLAGLYLKKRNMTKGKKLPLCLSTMDESVYGGWR